MTLDKQNDNDFLQQETVEEVLGHIDESANIDPALCRIIEGMLFVACEPLHVRDLAGICDCTTSEIRSALSTIRHKYTEGGFILRELGGGWQFVTPEDLSPYIEKLYRPKMNQLSNAAMETLAIIAYKQPICRADIAAIRQVEVDGVVGTLLDKKLIKEVGRRAGVGRAVLYGTTEEFLRFFGISSLSDLPDLHDSDTTVADDNNLGTF